MTPTAPIALFAHRRLDHVRRTVDSLLENTLAGDSDLIVYSDGPATPAQRDAVAEVRAFLSTITGFRSVAIRTRETNLGLAESIIQGVTEVLQASNRIIVLEDDMVTSPHFLAYMNNALERYEAVDRVVSIHGYMYPVGDTLPEAFFLPGADCWGWATWRRGWKCFNPDGQALLAELKRRKLVRAFDYNGAYPYSRMLKAQIRGENDSWAVRWYASAFLADKLTLYPGRTLVRNVGNDGTGTHSSDTAQFDAEPSKTPIDLSGVPVAPSRVGRRAIQRYFWQLTRRKLAVRASAALGTARTMARDWVPPVVQRSLSGGESGGIRFEGDFATWTDARAESSGYDTPEILAKVLDATLEVMRGEAAYERDSVLFHETEYSWPILGGLLWAAARGNGRLNVLDYGGALGSSYFQYREFTEVLPDVRWNVVEQPHFVAAAQDNGVAGGRLQFYRTIDECLSDGQQPNVLLLSSVLQYLESPGRLIRSLTSVGAEVLIVDRTPFSDEAKDRLLIQRVPASIYRASYPMWVFARSPFLDRMQADWRLVSSSTSPEGATRSDEGLRFSFSGLIFEGRR